MMPISCSYFNAYWISGSLFFPNPLDFKVADQLEDDLHDSLLENGHGGKDGKQGGFPSQLPYVKEHRIIILGL